MKYRVILGFRARRDLLDLYEYIAKQKSPDVSAAYFARVDRLVTGLGMFPKRGDRRDDIQPSLRTVGFERITVAFEILESEDAVRIVRILYGGRQLDIPDLIDQPEET